MKQPGRLEGAMVTAPKAEQPKFIVGPNGLVVLAEPRECPGCHRMAYFLSCKTGRTLCVECSDKEVKLCDTLMS